MVTEAKNTKYEAIAATQDDIIENMFVINTDMEAQITQLTAENAALRDQLRWIPVTKQPDHEALVMLADFSSRHNGTLFVSVGWYSHMTDEWVSTNRAITYTHYKDCIYIGLPDEVQDDIKANIKLTAENERLNHELELASQLMELNLEKYRTLQADNERLTADLAEWRKDAERLAGKYEDDDGYCIHCVAVIVYGPNKHAPDCPITLHRELVAKYGGEK